MFLRARCCLANGPSDTWLERGHIGPLQVGIRHYAEFYQPGGIKIVSVERQSYYITEYAQQGKALLGEVTWLRARSQQATSKSSSKPDRLGGSTHFMLRAIGGEELSLFPQVFNACNMTCLYNIACQGLHSKKNSEVFK